MSTAMHRRALSLLLAGWALCLASAGALAQSQLSFPGEAPNKRVLRAQQQAELAYRRGEYDRAFWIYRKELAPVGDKYAQYMVGYMYLSGEGVATSEIDAAAWFLLAAERGHEELVDVSVDMQRRLSLEQRQRAQQIALELKNEMGDRRLVTRLIRRDLARLQSQTGSRTGSCSQPVRVYAPNGGAASTSLERFCQILQDRIDERTRYLGTYVEYGELELKPDDAPEGADGSPSN
jgi:hypothetical protein